MNSKWELLMLGFVVCILCSCGHSYSVLQREYYDKSGVVEDLYGPACLSPTYIATLGVNAIDKDTIIIQEQLTMYNLLVVAQKKFGTDVTIQNVRWDLRNKKKISAIFDVVKCSK
jgi:hypothetical protein